MWLTRTLQSDESQQSRRANVLALRGAVVLCSGAVGNCCVQLLCHGADLCAMCGVRWCQMLAGAVIYGVQRWVLHSGVQCVNVCVDGNMLLVKMGS